MDIVLTVDLAIAESVYDVSGLVGWLVSSFARSLWYITYYGCGDDGDSDGDSDGDGDGDETVGCTNRIG
jgi:hypothetical protein